MADKIACRISLLHLFSSAKWFKEFNAVLKDKGSEKLIFQFHKQHILVGLFLSH